MNPDVSGEHTNTVVDKERERWWWIDGDGARGEGEGGGIVETKVVGKDESTRLA